MLVPDEAPANLAMKFTIDRMPAPSLAALAGDGITNIRKDPTSPS